METIKVIDFIISMKDNNSSSKIDYIHVCVCKVPRFVSNVTFTSRVMEYTSYNLARYPSTYSFRKQQVIHYNKDDFLSR